MKVEHKVKPFTCNLMEIHPGECFHFNTNNAGRSTTAIYMRIWGDDIPDFSLPGDIIRYVLLADGREFKSDKWGAKVVPVAMKLVVDIK